MEKQVSLQGKNINYTLDGSGPAVVLLHGFLENLNIWNNMTASLKNSFTVIAVDLPGFGKTEMLSDNHGMPLMADAVELVLEAEKIATCILVGHSMGGYVALAFAEKLPSKINGLVLFHSQAAADDLEARKNRDRAIEVVKNNHFNFIVDFVPLLFAEENVDKYQNEIAELKTQAEQTTTDGICAALAGMRDRNDHLQWLASTDIPLYFIIGKQDSRIAINKIMPQLHLPKNCEALILDGVGHMGFIEATKITTLAIKHFAERMNW